VECIPINSIQDFTAEISAGISSVLDSNRDPDLYVRPYFLKSWLSNMYGFKKSAKILIFSLPSVDGTNNVIGYLPIILSRGSFVYRLSPWGSMFGYPMPIVKREYVNVFLDAFNVYCREEFGHFAMDFGPAPIQWFSEVTFESASFRFQVDLKIDAPFIDLSKFLAPHQKRFRKHLKSNVKHFERIGTKVEFLEAPNSKIQELVKVFGKFHTERWPESNFLKFAKFEEFHVEMINSAMSSDNCLLAVMSQGSEPIAFILGFFSGDRFLFFNQSYNQKYSEFSPGNVLIWETIQHLKSQHTNIKIFDFMNDLEEYKLRWTNQIGSRHSLIIYSGWISNPKLLKFSRAHLTDFYQWRVKRVVRNLLARP